MPKPINKLQYPDQVKRWIEDQKNETVTSIGELTPKVGENPDGGFVSWFVVTTVETPDGWYVRKDDREVLSKENFMNVYGDMLGLEGE